ncbi:MULTISPECIES: hypothetical protein [unclassified Mesorhizobium]|uniref:hypothetical protein n=1 Tax=unclassified Mesorhizobium TaxID=325217 RepID=UPI0010923956|nr:MULTISPECIES: hypothetical protein [unclassified Mesorhizobium]TGP93825.1 hypothetical protein EN861_17200 [Mesorhizobium sp. M8A.F.Ca.ET.218.01.1.1]TGT18122.1 hypothetical protein EN856_16730 [Mesorhizobium sp. M8A.F.Ca.ET.213.01.1.1]
MNDRPSVFQLFSAFDEAAQAWGYQADQGTGEQLQRARLEYEQAKGELLQRLMETREAQP